MQFQSIAKHPDTENLNQTVGGENWNFVEFNNRISSQGIFIHTIS